MTGYTTSTLWCHWCGVSLSTAKRVTYLNGNLPVCDLCLIKNDSPKPVVYTPVFLFENTKLINKYYGTY